jgi:hypothetical protein
MTRRRSSTPPSSKSARHRGPTSGSCSTRIGVTARSRGTTITTPAPAQPRAFQHPDGALFDCGKGGERRGALPSVAPGSGAAVEKTPKPLPPPHARIVQPRRSAPLACVGKGVVGILGFGCRGGRGEELTCIHWRNDSSLASSAASAVAAMAAFDELRERFRGRPPPAPGNELVLSFSRV